VNSRKKKGEIMAKGLNWLSDHKFKVHLLALALMVLPPIPMYMAAQRDVAGWIWFMLGFVVAGNLLVLLSR
jgi:hypothetical protein